MPTLNPTDDVFLTLCTLLAAWVTAAGLLALAWARARRLLALSERRLRITTHRRLEAYVERDRAVAARGRAEGRARVLAELAARESGTRAVADTVDDEDLEALAARARLA